MNPAATVHAKLDEIVAAVEGARAMPMSASCIVNRGELLASLDELRDLLPGELRAAGDLLATRDDVVAEGRAEAERIIAEAHAERARLVGKAEVAREAQREAERLRAASADEADTMRREIDEYVDTKLANFEVVLTKTLAAVERGRQKLRGHSELDDLAAIDPEAEPLPGA